MSDRNQYIFTSSMQVLSVNKDIKFVLAWRIKRNFTNPQQGDLRLMELKTILLLRNYTEGRVDSTIERFILIN